jgi:hypothetical protein
MGGFIVPPMPAELVAALKRQTAPPGAPLGAGLPVAGRPPMASPVVAQPPTGQPLPAASTNLGPTGANVAPATPGKVPPVTDDPSVPKGPAATGSTDDLESRGMLSRISPQPAAQPAAPAMPKSPDLASYLNPALKQYQSDLSGYQQADQANRLDPQQLRPKWWERLAGFALGATQLKDPSNAGNVASEVTNRRLNEATANRERALAPWTQRLQMDKEGTPLAEAAERTAHEQGQLDVERFNALTNSDYKDAIAAIREEVAKGNIEKAQDLLDQKQKELEEKKDKDAEYFKMQHALLDIRQQLADAATTRATKEKDRTGQSVAAETAKANALTAAEDKYRKGVRQATLDFGAGTDEYKQAVAALDDERETDKQRAEDAYEAKSSELKGAPVEHQDVESWRGNGAKPGAQPAAAPPASSAAPGPAAKPAAKQDEGVPTAMGPKGETPAKTASDGKTKIGYYKSTGQWMLVPQSQGAK